MDSVKLKAAKKATTAQVHSDDKPGLAAVGETLSTPPAKKARIPKAKIWPPPDVAPDLHPTRAGLPVFPLPSLSVRPNGGIGAELSAARPHLVGAHVSIGGGVGGALLRAGMAGANGLAMFVKSQRQWKSNPYESQDVERFRELMKSKTEGGGSNSCFEYRA